MPASPPPIIFTITEAGKNAALNLAKTGLKLHLTEMAIGGGRYVVDGSETGLVSEIDRSAIISGDISSIGHTLRFTSQMYADNITEAYEIGLMTDNNVLFAVASSTTEPLLTLYPNIAFVGTFGLTLDDMALDSITIETDPDGALSLHLITAHEQATDPHPQYLNNERFAQFLEVAYPYGHKYWANVNENPKEKFDALFGYETFWRRLKGVHLIAVDEAQPPISGPMRYVGDNGDVTPNTSNPDYYQGYTGYLWERYDAADNIFRYDGKTLLDGTARFL